MQTALSESSSNEVPPTRIRNRLSAAEVSTRTGMMIEVDDSRVLAAYANFCRVSSTPEELILDLGLNPQSMNTKVSQVSVSQRIIINHYTAKRLLATLSTAIQRHEEVFGLLETDVRRRVRSN